MQTFHGDCSSLNCIDQGFAVGTREPSIEAVELRQHRGPGRATGGGVDREGVETVGATALLGIRGGGVAVAGPADVASRAAEFFQESSSQSTAKTGGVPIPADHALVDSTAAPQGRTVNLWVTDPAAPTPRPDDRCPEAS